MKDLTGSIAAFPPQRTFHDGDAANEENFARLFQDAADRTQYLYNRCVRYKNYTGASATAWPGGWTQTGGGASWDEFSSFNVAASSGSLNAGDVIVVKSSLWAKMSGASEEGEIGLAALQDDGVTYAAIGTAGIHVSSTTYQQFYLCGHYTMGTARVARVRLEGRRTVGTTYYPVVASPLSINLLVMRKHP